MTQLYRLLASPLVVWTLLLLPIASFFVYFFALRYNIPWLDDFENIPYFLDQFLTAPTFVGKMTALLRPNNEHRVVYARLIVLSQYFLTGKLNFANLMLWGNLGLLVIFGLLYRALRWHERRPVSALVGLLPVPMLLFTAQNYIMTFTAIFSLQYLAIITLVMLTLFVLTTDRKLHFGLVLGLGLLCTFSMGNGLFVWPAGVGLLFVQRRWKAMGIWTGVGALSVYLYFQGYPVQQGNAEGFDYVMQHPLQTVAGFLIFAGSVFDIFPTLPHTFRYYLPFVAGLILMTGLVWWLLWMTLRTWYTIQHRQPVGVGRSHSRLLHQRDAGTKPTSLEAFVFGCLLFLLANIALIALFRFRFDFGLALHITYRIYAMTLWAVALVLLFSRLSERSRIRVWPVVCLFSLGLSVLSYANYLPEAVEYQKTKQGQTFNQLHNGIGLGGSRNSPLASYIANLIVLMQNRGWYRLPDPAINSGEHQLLAQVGPITAIPLRINSNPEFILISSDEKDYNVSRASGVYVVLKSDRYTYLLFASKHKPLTFRPWDVNPGFVASTFTSLIQRGRYRLGLFYSYPDRSTTQFTNQFVDVP